MYNYNLINGILNEHLKNAKPYELLYIQKMVNIINNNPKELYETKYKDNIEVYQSLKLVYKFLYDLKPSYAEYFEKAIKQGRVYLDYDLDCGWSFHDENNYKIMLIPIRHHIHDSSTMVHELMHDLNLKPGKVSTTRFLFTESISILGEMLYHDYLIDNNLHVHDARANLKKTFWYTNRINMRNDFDIQLMLDFLNDRYVNDKTIKSLKGDEEYNYQINYSLSDIIDYASFGFDSDQTYSIGILFSCYMYDRIKSNKKYLEELFEINEFLNDVSFRELMSYLDLESVWYDEFLLTNDSLNKLDKAYQKILKNIG